jgi:hypothetical protein
MEGASTVVHFVVKDAEGLVELTFPDGPLVVHFLVKEEEGLLQLRFAVGPLVVQSEDVARSGPLQDMLDSATDSGSTTLTLPSTMQALYLQLWAEAVQPGEEVFQEGADRLAQCLEVR